MNGQELEMSFLKRHLYNKFLNTLFELNFPNDINLLPIISFSMATDFMEILRADDFDLAVSKVAKFVENAELISGVSRFTFVDSQTKMIGTQKKPFIWTNGCYDILNQNVFASDNDFVYLKILWDFIGDFVNEYFLDEFLRKEPGSLAQELKNYHTTLLISYNEFVSDFWNSVIDDCFECVDCIGGDLVHIPYDKILSAAYVRLLTAEQLNSMPIEYIKDDQNAIIAENIMASSELFEIAKIIKPASKPLFVKSNSTKNKYRTYRNKYSGLLSRSLKFRSLQGQFKDITFSLNMHNFAMIYQKMHGEKIDNKQMYSKIFSKIYERLGEAKNYKDDSGKVHVQVLYNPNSKDKFSLSFGRD